MHSGPGPLSESHTLDTALAAKSPTGLPSAAIASPTGIPILRSSQDQAAQAARRAPPDSVIRPFRSPLAEPVWRRLLAPYPNRQLVESLLRGISNGVDIRFQGRQQQLIFA